MESEGSEIQMEERGRERWVGERIQELQVREGE